MKNVLSRLITVLLLCVITTVAMAKDPIFGNRRGAIKGYDPVAYFVLGKPTKGKKEYSYKWRGATWRFSNQGHLELFKRDPERYAPQYGGYCAYGMVDGKQISINPGAWVIHDDKLYLNYNRSIQNIWLQNKQGHIDKADNQFEENFAPRS